MTKYIYEVSRGCTRCLMCYYECPVKAITIIPDKTAVIDKDKCTGCGKCARNCASEAIVKIKIKIINN